MDTKPDLKSQATHETRLLEGAILYTALFLVVLISFATLLLWSAQQPDHQTYLPSWLTANPAPEAELLPPGD